jgi:tetratricopeptide (TPR) repeat protein
MARGESSKFYNELLKDLIAIKSKAVGTGYKWAESDALFLLGQLEKNHGNTDEAINYYNQALKLQKRLRDPRSNLTLKGLQELGVDQ